jgi:hypothetical protein
MPGLCGEENGTWAVLPALSNQQNVSSPLKLALIQLKLKELALLIHTYK